MKNEIILFENQILKDYMIKGYAVKQKRLDYLQKTLKLIDIASRIDDEIDSSDAKEILKIIDEYSKVLNSLDDYDHRVVHKINGNFNDK